MLEAVGVSPEVERVYRALLAEPGSSVADLAHNLATAEDDVCRWTSDLEELGLVHRPDTEPGTLIPVRPDVAVDILVARERIKLDEAAMGARALLSEMQTMQQQRPENLVEVVVGQSMIANRFAQLLNTTERELMVIDRPPYAATPEQTDATVRGKLRDGVRVWGLYSPDSLNLPGAVDEAFSAADAGEVSRVHPKVPMKLAIFDQRIALLPLAVDQLVDSALVVHPCALLDALIEMFNLLWGQALPVVGPADAVAPGDARLMTMLASGLKDDAIARQLDLSSRTVGRRVAELMDRLGARTRFQAGVHAQRRQLLDPAVADDDRNSPR